MQYGNAFSGIFFYVVDYLSITARGIPASNVPVETSFLGFMTLKYASVLARAKYNPTMPTTLCNVGPKRGLTIPNPRLTIMTNILKERVRV